MTYRPHSNPKPRENEFDWTACVCAHRNAPERQRRAVDGLLVCRGCLDRIERDLCDLPGLDADLVLAHLGRRSNGEHTSGGDIEAPIPIRPVIADLRKDLVGKLASWARLVCEDRDVNPPNVTVPALAAFLVAHLAWIAAQPFIDEFDGEIRRLRSRAFGLAFPSGRRQFPVADCTEADCPGTLIAVIRDIDVLLPSSVICDYDATHDWTAAEWSTLQRTVERLHREETA